MTTDQPTTNACTDAPPGSDWTCRDGDGTGLWCDACRQRAEVAPRAEGWASR